jgi:hypothetical protein
MKLVKILMGLIILIPFLQACQDDISDLDDPRDAIVKLWRVTDNSDTYAGTNGYDVTISKDNTEITRVLFTNFHYLGTSDKLYATLAGSTLTIPTQVLDQTFTISGTGLIANDLNSIDFNYSVQEGSDPAKNFTAHFGEVITTKKKAATTVNLVN